MAPRILSENDLRFYLYRSRSKIEMLYEQIFDSSTRSSKKQLSVGAKVLTASMESSSQEVVSFDQKIRAVDEELDRRKMIGTLDEPKSYFRGVMKMRWGYYNDCGTRPDDAPALVYFSGFDPTDEPLVVGLGGSFQHVEGHYGATSTWSRSAAPALTNWLISGLKNDQPPSPIWSELYTTTAVYEGMAVALNNFPPTNPVHVQFVAKNLSEGVLEHYDYMLGVPRARMLLGTPLWVASLDLGESEQQRWGLDHDQWRTD